MVEKRQMGPPNQHGVLGPQNPVEGTSGTNYRGAEWSSCHKSQPLEMEEFPNLNVSPKPRGNKIMGVSVFKGPPVPEELEKYMGTPSSPRAGMGDPEAVSGQRQNIDWWEGLLGVGG